MLDVILSNRFKKDLKLAATPIYSIDFLAGSFRAACFLFSAPALDRRALTFHLSYSPSSQHKSHVSAKGSPTRESCHRR